MKDVEGDGETEPSDDGPRNPTITSTGGVQRLAESTPGNSTAVVALHLLATPYAGTLNIEKDCPVRGKDNPHDDEVENAALDTTIDYKLQERKPNYKTHYDRPQHLDCEDGARRYLTVLAHLQVTKKSVRLRDRVVTVHGEVLEAEI